MQRSVEPRERDRRSAIRFGLFCCLRDKGYSATTLADVAAAAGISPSHLLYYFPSKDAVLEDLFEVLARNMLDDVGRLPGGTPQAKLDALADYFFGGKTMTRTEQATMLQMFGLSTHNRHLWKTKSSFDREFKDWLTGLFRHLPGRTELPAPEAAEAVFALLVGLLTDAYFDARVDPARSRGVFRESVARLTGR